MRRRTLLLLFLAGAAACNRAPAATPEPPPTTPLPVVPEEQRQGAVRALDPGSIAISLADAIRGVPGKGPLVVRLDVETAGAGGTLHCELHENRAPRTVANFVALARGLRSWKDPRSGQWVKRPLYDGTIFHRVIPELMIQGGDPRGTGTGDPGYLFEDETRLEPRLDRGGVLAMANHGPDTNGSQFFITAKETPWLNGRHTVFGQCDDLELVKRLARVPADARNRPLRDVVLKKVTVQRGRR